MSIVKTEVVKTEDELFNQIGSRLDEIKRLIHNYTEYIVRKNAKKTCTSSSSVAPDTICLAMLKSGTRCAKKRCDDGPDLTLCKLHNNPRYVGAIAKFEGPADTPNESVDQDSSTSSSSASENYVQVKLTVDADGHTIDHEGNIWCLDKQEVIGKKDLRTKHKVFFKTV